MYGKIKTAIYDEIYKISRRLNENLWNVVQQISEKSKGEFFEALWRHFRQRYHFAEQVALYKKLRDGLD